MSNDVTIYDIAKKLNISIATVSRALQGNPLVKKKTIQKVTAAAEEMGYRYNYFAGSLSTKKTHTIGVLVHELFSTFIISVLAGIEKVTSEAGYHIIIEQSSENFEKEKANAKNLFHKRVDGLIASLTIETKNLDHFNIFREKEIPVIFFDRVDEHGESAKVVIDNHRAGYLATQHLIEQGFKRIAMVTNSLNRNVYAQRHAGYRDALIKNGIGYDEKLVLVYRDLTEECTIEASKQILGMDPMPDAIFYTADFAAVISMKYLKAHGVRIPEDIAVVGFNNELISRIIEPALTTVNYPSFSMGEMAARVLVNHLEGIATMANTDRIIINSELVVRESSIKKQRNTEEK